MLTVQSPHLAPTSHPETANGHDARRDTDELDARRDSGILGKYHLATSSGLALVPMLRSQNWLRGMLSQVWLRYFPDVPAANDVTIAYVGTWKSRLGVITLSDDHRVSSIKINSLLSRIDVPTCLTIVTIAHELVHYSHGFGSPLPRRRRYPHKGNVVVNEIRKRGLHDEYTIHETWIHHFWYEYYEKWQDAKSLHRETDVGSAASTYLIP